MMLASLLLPPDSASPAAPPVPAHTYSSCACTHLICLCLHTPTLPVPSPAGGMDEDQRAGGALLCFEGLAGLLAFAGMYEQVRPGEGGEVGTPLQRALFGLSWTACWVGWGTLDRMLGGVGVSWTACWVGCVCPGPHVGWCVCVLDRMLGGVGVSWTACWVGWVYPRPHVGWGGCILDRMLGGVGPWVYPGPHAGWGGCILGRMLGGVGVSRAAC